MKRVTGQRCPSTVGRSGVMAPLHDKESSSFSKNLLPFQRIFFHDKESSSFSKNFLP